jgi:uncharacterized damage-inducible protein DinB
MGKIMGSMEYLRRQFAYNTWANREVFAALKQTDSPAMAQSWKLLGHILAAERLWLERLERQQQTVSPWEEFPPERCATEITDMAERWNAYLAQLSPLGLSKQVPYKNTRGEQWESEVQDVLNHVILHSAYHRGQIASSMRANGETPAMTDFIHAVRQGFIK